eukprot:3062212-Rhodomonas_salina.3
MGSSGRIGVQISGDILIASPLPSCHRDLEMSIPGRDIKQTQSTLQKPRPRGRFRLLSGAHLLSVG